MKTLDGQLSVKKPVKSKSQQPLSSVSDGGIERRQKNVQSIKYIVVSRYTDWYRGR